MFAGFAEGIAKPDVRLFERALERAGVPASETVFVGDSPSLDIRPARSVGMRAVLIDRDADFPDFSGEVIRSLTELTALTGS